MAGRLASLTHSVRLALYTRADGCDTSRTPRRSSTKWQPCRRFSGRHARSRRRGRRAGRRARAGHRRAARSRRLRCRSRRPAGRCADRTELTSLADAILTVGSGDPGLTADSLARLATLSHRVHVQVFSTPTCVHCPRAVALAHRLAVASPLISATAYSVIEFPDLIRRHRVTGVPKNHRRHWRRAARGATGSRAGRRRSHCPLAAPSSHHARHRNRRRHQDVRVASRRGRSVAQRPRRHDLRLHRAERLGQDDDAPDDHAHPAARPRRRSACSGAGIDGGQRRRRLPAGGARAVPQDEGRPAAPVLRRAEGRRGGRHRSRDRPSGWSGSTWPSWRRQADRGALEGHVAEGAVHRHRRRPARAGDPRRAVQRPRSGQRRRAARRDARAARGAARRSSSPPTTWASPSRCATASS